MSIFFIVICLEFNLLSVSKSFLSLFPSFESARFGTRDFLFFLFLSFFPMSLRCWLCWDVGVPQKRKKVIFRRSEAFPQIKKKMCGFYPCIKLIKVVVIVFRFDCGLLMVLFVYLMDLGKERERKRKIFWAKNRK